MAYSNGTLDIHTKIWMELFDSQINKIIGHLGKLLKLPVLNGCKYLCLVGGFSCSKYLQSKIEKTFGMTSDYKDKLVILLPEAPLLSVVVLVANVFDRDACSRDNF